MATYNGHNEDSSGNILLSIGNGMTATVETGTTASQAYTKGSYLFFNNRLCKATSAISSGATLAIGTNLSQTSIGQEITSHLRSSDGKEFYFDVKDGTYGYYPSASKTASEFVPFGGTSLPKEVFACFGGGLPYEFYGNDSSGYMVSSGGSVQGQYIKCVYTEASPWANSTFTITAVKKCKVTQYINDGAFIGTSATYNANDTIATIYRHSTAQPTIFLAEDV